MAYITQADVEAKLGTTLTEDQASYLEDTLIPSIASYIDYEAGTFFDNDTTTDEYVDGNGSNMLIVPTMWSVESVYSIDSDDTETELDASTYTVYPRSGPVYAVRRKNGTWDDGFENYKVVGKLGYEGLPSVVKNIALEMAVNELTADTNNYKSERVGDWSVTYGDTAKAPVSSNSLLLLQGYRRISRSV